MNFFLRLKIRFKLLIAFGSILLISASLMGYAFYSINEMYNYFMLNEKVNDLNANILKVNQLTTEFSTTGYKSEDFLKNGNADLLINCRNSFSEIKELTHSIMENPLLNSGMSELIKEFDKGIIEYEHVFNELVGAYTVRGFKDYGVE
jgi:hypothetical protein